MMWRSDGRPAKHPTFALVLHNHMTRTALQGQGRFSLNTSDMDPNTTIKELREAIKNGKGDKTAQLLEDLQKRTQVFSGNVTGTEAYWRAAYHEFMAVILFNSYIKDEEMSFFTTVRLLFFFIASSLFVILIIFVRGPLRSIMNTNYDSCWRVMLKSWMTTTTVLTLSKF